MSLAHLSCSMNSLKKRFTYLVVVLAILSLVSGILLSKASLIGRTGINLFYKEYKFLKVWWQGALVVFVVLLLLAILQGIAERKLYHKKAKVVQLGCLLAAVAGMYFTYLDFRHTTTHRLLGERFHLGGYLFWIGWIIICCFYLFQKQKPTELPVTTSTMVD